MNSPATSTSSGTAPHIVQIESSSSWRTLLAPAVIVIVGLAIAWALFAHFGISKPDASGAVLRELAYPVQVDGGSSQADAGMEGATAEQDEVILLVQAKVTNTSQKPLSIFDLVSDVKLDGENNRSTAALPEDIDRLVQRFPDLAPMRMQPLARHQVIAPGQSAEGLMVFNYPWSKQQWDKRQAAAAVVSFQDGHPLTIPLQ